MQPVQNRLGYSICKMVERSESTDYYADDTDYTYYVQEQYIKDFLRISA